jgi:NAD(P)-dependent dehydrogenase (short-subunit alcohol dehydrogenase family)
MNEGILREVDDPDALMAEWVSMHPIGRIGMPEEVAPAILYLASDESAFVTGMLLRVDGGMVVKAG